MVECVKMNDGEQKNTSIAIIGSRGIPNNYGGFEGFTEVLSQNLTKKGYNVYVSVILVIMNLQTHLTELTCFIFQ